LFEIAYCEAAEQQAEDGKEDELDSACPAVEANLPGDRLRRGGVGRGFAGPDTPFEPGDKAGKGHRDQPGDQGDQEECEQLPLHDGTHQQQDEGVELV